MKRAWLSRFYLLFYLFLSFLLTIHSWGNITIYQHPHHKIHPLSTHPQEEKEQHEEVGILAVTGNQTNPAPLPQWELDVLYDLYNSTQGEYWIWTGVPWNFSESNANPCSEDWEGVTCLEASSKSVNGSDSCAEHVYSIILSNNNMTGSLPSSLGQLEQMRNLGVTSNIDLIGSIPSSPLKYVNISTNLFSGDTSPLSSLENMVILDISFNGLTGPFRACENMSKLLWLFLRGNELSGSLSGVFTSISTPSLYYLDLSNNRFSGPFPWLNTLAAVQNCFTGTLSSDICNTSKLEVLALDGLSAAPSCRRATVTLSDGLSSSWVPSYIMGKHVVHGSLPSCLFQELSVLATLHLSGNNLEGSIPELLDSSSLTDLSLSHNELTGTVPESIQSNAWINLDLSFNKLTGTLKSSSWSSSLRNGSIALEINRLSGKIPSSYYDMSDVDVLRGNIFSCGEDGESDEESLPPNDPYKSQYGCGSVTLNVSLLVWVSVVGGLLLLGVCVWVCLSRRRSRQGDQEVSGRELELEKEKEKEAVYGEGTEVSEAEGKSLREGVMKEEVLGVGGRWSCCEGGLDKVEVLLKFESIEDDKVGPEHRRWWSW
eukprot:scaffold3372_cov155-Ochromonas_danica.AAC.1